MAEVHGWKALCKEARRALADGRRTEARRLAHLAAKQAPEHEEPWLLLAALASAGASQAYLKRALNINPRSPRAIKAMRWAEERQSEARHARGSHGGLPVVALPRSVNVALLSLLGLTAVLAAFVWLRPPAFDEGLRLAGAAAARQFDGLLSTETREATAEFTATFTPFASMSPLPSNTPTPSSTPPATQTPTPEPTASAELNLGSIEKHFVELPEGVGNKERWIDVNLSDQTLSAYEGVKLLDTFTISSGRPNTPTVTGEFRIWVKVRKQTMSGPGYSLPNVPWVMYFYKDYGIHGTWWHNNFGTPMSAGCVNMTIDDAQWMYGWASVGTIVKVHY
ncbi:MAG: L,D-transpeptidase [Anaerolineales bacterium]